MTPSRYKKIFSPLIAIWLVLAGHANAAVTLSADQTIQSIINAHIGADGALAIIIPDDTVFEDDKRGEIIIEDNMNFDITVSMASYGGTLQGNEYPTTAFDVTVDEHSTARLTFLSIGFDGFETAIHIGEVGTNAHVTVVNSTFVDCTTDISIKSDPTDASKPDAAYNYWGDVSGPIVEPGRLFGKGARIIGAIAFAPFYRDDKMMVPSTMYVVEPASGSRMNPIANDSISYAIADDIGLPAQINMQYIHTSCNETVVATADERVFTVPITVPGCIANQQDYYSKEIEMQLHTEFVSQNNNKHIFVYVKC